MRPLFVSMTFPISSSVVCFSLPVLCGESFVNGYWRLTCVFGVQLFNHRNGSSCFSVGLILSANENAILIFLLVDISIFVGDYVVSYRLAERL